MKMKSIVAMLFIGMTSTMTYAATCENDVDQMQSQISKYESITSKDGFRFDDVGNPAAQDARSCMAQGYRYGRFVCNIRWTKGNWGDTFHCA